MGFPWTAQPILKGAAAVVSLANTENYGAEHTVLSLRIRRSARHSSSLLYTSLLVNTLCVFLSVEPTAACSPGRQARAGACVAGPKVFTRGEIIVLGLAWVFLLRKDRRQGSRALHAVCTVIYTAEGCCTRCLTQSDGNHVLQPSPALCALPVVLSTSKARRNSPSRRSPMSS